MMASAILVSLQDDSPFVGYVMTLTAHKNTCLARPVTTASMKSLAAAGHERAVLYITDGNAPSEAMFTGVGAVQTAD